MDVWLLYGILSLVEAIYIYRLGVVRARWVTGMTLAATGNYLLFAAMRSSFGPYTALVPLPVLQNGGLPQLLPGRIGVFKRQVILTPGQYGADRATALMYSVVSCAAAPPPEVALGEVFLADPLLRPGK